MLLLSPCCHASIGQGAREESPLGDSYTIAYKLDVCLSCGQEVDQPLIGCDNCGQPSDELTTLPYGDYCPACVTNNE